MYSTFTFSCSVFSFKIGELMSTVSSSSSSGVSGSISSTFEPSKETLASAFIFTFLPQDSLFASIAVLAVVFESVY